MTSINSPQITAPPPTFLFVGERPSKRSLQLGVTWESGALAAAQLFDALEHSGWNPHEQHYMNLYCSPCRGDREDVVDERRALSRIRCARQAGLIVVDMGRIVQRVLSKAGVEHLRLHHPAARGSLRLRSRYRRHLREALNSHTPMDRVRGETSMGGDGGCEAMRRAVMAGFAGA